MIKINNRLKKISSFVDQNSLGIIDVGCDHALLDIYLKEKYKDLKIFASDINDGPLENAKYNLKKYDMLDKIELIKCDGIEKINENVDTIIISGMGCENIINILTKDISKLNKIKKLVISSNNKNYLLREKITKLGFLINREVIVYEGNKYYIVIEFLKGKKVYSLKELYFGPILLKNKDDFFYNYYNSRREKLMEVLHNLPKENINNIKSIKNEIKLLEKEI